MSGVVGHRGLLLQSAGSIPTDPLFAFVTALLHFDGADGSTTITDVIGNTWTVNGNAQLDTAIPKYGSAALLLDGTGDYLNASSAGFTFGTGDFCIETWFRWVGSDNQGPFSTVLSATHTGAVGCSIYSTGLYLQNNDTATFYTATVTPGTYYHVAVVRNGSTLSLYLNGVSIGSVSDTRNLSSSNMYIGGFYSTAFLLNGSIDDFRVTKGHARYTANFTPPAAAFPNS